jgi:hypothetical protein
LPPAPEGPGRLIALEGVRGTRLAAAARDLTAVVAPEEGGHSLWDASNIFYEMRLGKAKKLAPTARTLLLLYASDLAFRLRWEIRPALAEGLTVVAAPYVESAIAFGMAASLPHKWMVSLFAFAPQPHTCYRLPEKPAYPEDHPKAGDGFLEFACSMMKHGTPPWDPKEIWAGVHAYLDDLEARHGCRTI